MKHSRIFSLLLSVALVSSSLLLCRCSPSGSQNNIVINEVVTSNRYSHTASDGTAPDWVELYNNSNKPVNLSGWGLTDDKTDPYKFTFPDMTINSGEYLLVYCNGAEQTDAEDGILRTGFKLSSKGEFLALTDANGTNIQSLNIDTLNPDISYGRKDDGSYAYYNIPTPGAANQGDTNSEPVFNDSLLDSAIKINEYITDSKYTITDSDGERYCWVEIINTGASPVDLTGYGLSNDADDPKKWSFPEMTLQPGEIRLVFLSGKDKTDPNGELHANFKLHSSDTSLVLSQELGHAIDEVPVDTQFGNCSYGRSTDYGAWLYFDTPTPGAVNDTQGVSEISQIDNSKLHDLYISEVKTAKSKESPAWIELHNTGIASIDLTGYGLSNDSHEAFLYTFPQATIQPGGYLVVYIKSLPENALSSLLADTFSLDPDGDNVFLCKPDGSVVDTMNSGVQYLGITRGRAESSGECVYFTTPTPGAANSSEYCADYTQKPKLSAGGYVEAGYSVEITAEDGAAIYYTTDGSKPTTSSAVYSGPISINSSAPVRAIAVASGKLSSECATENYIIDQKHDIPVVCISVDDDQFFGYDNGIYSGGPGYSSSAHPHRGANYWKDIEREISFEWFEADGTRGIEAPAGIKIFGQYSRAFDQRSLAIKFKGSYGMGSVTYPFFRDYDVTTFNSLILRTSGQDVNCTKLRDALYSQITKHEMDLDYMEYRPCAVYINGQYWGLYNLREQEDENYISNHYGVDTDSIDLMQKENTVRCGSDEAWDELLEYVKSHDLSDSSAYAYVSERVDIEEFTDYMITEIFFSNPDSDNIKYWRSTDNGGKFRWMLYDLDLSLMSEAHSKNYLAEYFHVEGHGYNHVIPTVLQRGLLQNHEYKQYFIKRYAYHLTHTFRAERTNAILDQMANEIRTEMPRHIARWQEGSSLTCTCDNHSATPRSMEYWEARIEQLKSILTARVGTATQELKDYFGLSDAEMNELGLN